MLAPVVHILPLTKIRRERMLPVPGKVLVRRGQKVGANDVVAEAKLNPEHLLLHFARGLGLSEDEADQYLQCKDGMQVSQGDVLAGPVGMTKRVVRAPRTGRVVVAGAGQILLELEIPPYELKAGLPGTVTGLVDDRGAVIENVGALIQGVWGNGRIDYGLMNSELKSPEDLFTPDRLDVSQRGSIILGGYCDDGDVLRSAANLPLRGLILSSLDSTLISLAERVRIPVIVIEGFGQQKMNPAAYNLLTTNERREVALNAQTWDPYRGTRPEVIIPLPANVDPNLPQETVAFASGQQVRILRAPYIGSTASILELRPGMSTMPSGVMAASAEVQLGSGEKVVLPLANFEVIE